MPDDKARSEGPPQMSEPQRQSLLDAQTPQQQEIARRIYDRLKAGASLDDVRGLIEEMRGVILAERRAAQQGRRGRDDRRNQAGGRPS
jgi:hypothetical protein